MSGINTGRIIKIISNTYTVNIDGNLYECTPRGKFRYDKITPLVGDFVNIDIKNKSIESINERKNFLNRPAISNVDYALIVTSVKKPDIDYTLLDKLITVVLSQNITPLIVVTKMDLLNNKEKKQLKKIFNYYESIGIKVFYNNKLSKLKKYLKNKFVVLTGQTGAGKSSLLNRLNKRLNLDTNPISEALGRGVHTTRHTEIHEISKIFFADTPGFSALNIESIKKEDLKSFFYEFKNYICDFKNCNHINEKKCSIKDAVHEGKILKTRYESYCCFYKEAK